MKLLNMILLTSGILGSGVCAGIAKRQDDTLYACQLFAETNNLGYEYSMYYCEYYCGRSQGVTTGTCKSNDICNTFAYNRPDGKEYARPDDVYKECVGAMAKNHCGDKFGHKQAVCFKKYCSAFGYCGRK
ncbi:unnamed protein product [Tilletia controversa]|uniref:Uncharacterized protein n=3 Tax=Tilletia TaxID=13289 RepID=A0A8X7MNM0_9BASI|nr:hypothetical protein CF328_g5628 [Tilletia controversa]CAD6898333.1 unnamed protein product [Tilletia laevis]CAD6929487.1 unnamed protein product [Tilletia caries]KAE8243121.1 hypothetical protein A4X06_0g6538 [Tilletia controversa]CAD6918061.1 unnamed protein product [Tilletia laevis]